MVIFRKNHLPTLINYLHQPYKFEVYPWNDLHLFLTYFVSLGFH